jgi:hypothetical protein
MVQRAAVRLAEIRITPGVQQPARFYQAHEGLVVAGREGMSGEVAVQQRALLLPVLVGHRQFNDRDPGNYLGGVALLDDRLLQDPVGGENDVVVGGERLLAADRVIRDLGPEPGQARQGSVDLRDGLLARGRRALPDC